MVLIPETEGLKRTEKRTSVSLYHDDEVVVTGMFVCIIKVKREAHYHHHHLRVNVCLGRGEEEEKKKQEGGGQPVSFWPKSLWLINRVPEILHAI